MINGILERIDYKGYSQGLHVMAEELEWMEVASVNYDRLKRAAEVEMRRANPRIKRVAEGTTGSLNGRFPPAGRSTAINERFHAFTANTLLRVHGRTIDKPGNILPRLPKNDS